VCAPPSYGTLLVCYWNRGHPADPFRSLPIHVDAVCSTGHVADPCSHVPLSVYERHAGPVGPPHRTRRNHGQSVAVVLPVQHAGARLPILQAGSSSEDQVQLEGSQVETPLLDRQGQK
jgi:hypothetical protein